MTLLLVATTLLTLLFLFGAPATLLLMRLREGPRPSALPRAEAPPADVVGELGFVREGPGRYRLASETGPPVELEGLEVGGVLQHVHGMAVQGGWGELSVTPGTVPSQETGDVAFDRAHVVRGTALYLLDDAVRAAFLAPSSARRTLVDGRLMVAPAPEIDLAHALSLLRQLQQALDAAPGSDSALARDVAQDGAVRAEALRRSRDPALIADLEDDPDPVVRLLALLLGQPVDVERLAALAADGSAPAEVRQRAAAALPSLPDELLDAMIESEEPVLWSLVAKAAGGPKQRVERLGRLLRPGALDPERWPTDHRVPHVGARLAMAIAEAPPPDGEAMLLRLLAVPDARVRLQAVRALGRLGTRACMDELRRRVADDDVRVRREARRILTVMEGTSRGGVSVAPVAVGQGAVSMLPEGGQLAPAPDVPEGSVSSRGDVATDRRVGETR